MSKSRESTDPARISQQMQKYLSDLGYGGEDIVKLEKQLQDNDFRAIADGLKDKRDIIRNDVNANNPALGRNQKRLEASITAERELNKLLSEDPNQFKKALSVANAAEKIDPASSHPAGMTTEAQKQAARPMQAGESGLKKASTLQSSFAEMGYEQKHFAALAKLPNDEVSGALKRFATIQIALLRMSKSTPQEQKEKEARINDAITFLLREENKNKIKAYAVAMAATPNGDKIAAALNKMGLDIDKMASDQSQQKEVVEQNIKQNIKQNMNKQFYAVLAKINADENLTREQKGRLASQVDALKNQAMQFASAYNAALPTPPTKTFSAQAGLTTSAPTQSPARPVPSSHSTPASAQQPPKPTSSASTQTKPESATPSSMTSSGPITLTFVDRYNCKEMERSSIPPGREVHWAEHKSNPEIRKLFEAQAKSASDYSSRLSTVKYDPKTEEKQQLLSLTFPNQTEANRFMKNHFSHQNETDKTWEEKKKVPDNTAAPPTSVEKGQCSPGTVADRPGQSQNNSTNSSANPSSSSTPRPSPK